MYLQFKDYRNANEVLYVLYAADRVTGQSVSKLALQKLLYLAASFAPIKDIVLSMIRFNRLVRGPYSMHIQNTVDHLVAYGLVDITYFQVTRAENSLAFYRINEGGISAMEFLRQYSIEDEKAWWIACIVRLSYIYSQEDYLKNDEQFKGLDRIVRLVYQDKTFKDIDETVGYRGSIDFEMDEGVTQKLVEFTKSYIKETDKFHDLSEKVTAELILLAFFEQLFANYIEEKEAINVR